MISPNLGPGFLNFFVLDIFIAFILHLPKMVSFARTWDLSFDNSSSTSTFLSSMLEILELLKTPYMDGVYFLTPLAVLHVDKEEEGNTTTSFDLFAPTGASRRRRRLIPDKEIKEEEEGLTVL